jgi:tetratricopeptide (TPR) repeat protein
MDLEPENETPQKRMVSLYLGQSKRAIEGRKYRLAAKYAKSALGLSPDDPRAHELLGDIEERRHKYALALKCYEQASQASTLTPRQRERLKKKFNLMKKKTANR